MAGVGWGERERQKERNERKKERKEVRFENKSLWLSSSLDK
jgi:hypothetical protein